MNRLQKAFPSVDLRFQLISGKIGGPLDDVDLGMRYVNNDDTAEHPGVLLMPEILLPVCSPAYRDQAARQAADSAGDTLIHLSDGERDWYGRFPSFAQYGRRPGAARGPPPRG